MKRYNIDRYVLNHAHREMCTKPYTYQEMGIERYVLNHTHLEMGIERCVLNHIHIKRWASRDMY